MSTKKIILTTEEFLVIKNKLEDIKSHIYKTDFNLETYLNESFTQDQKDMIVQELDAGANATNLEKSIDTVLQKLSKVETITVKVPFEAPISFVNWIKEFLLDKTAKSESNLLLHIETDKSILAGVYLEYKGKIKSQSIKNEILNILSATN